MSFRHDKIRGNHPITPKKGIREDSMNGNRDVISVSDNRHNITPSSKRKIYHENTMTGREFYNSLPHDKKVNILATLMGIRPEDVDTGGLEYGMLDKWVRKGLDDMAKERNQKASQSFIHLGSSYFSSVIDPRSDGMRAQADIRYSKSNKEYQVYYSNHALLEKERIKGEKWFKTLKEALGFSKEFVGKSVPHLTKEHKKIIDEYVKTNPYQEQFTSRDWDAQMHMNSKVFKQLVAGTDSDHMSDLINDYVHNKK